MGEGETGWDKRMLMPQRMKIRMVGGELGLSGRGYPQEAKEEVELEVKLERSLE